MKRLLLVLLASVSLTAAVAALQPAVALAATEDEICQGVNTSAGGGGCTDPSSDVQRLITTVINLFSIVVGIIAVFMIIVGGFKFVTAGGDSGNITSAKHTILYALVGLVIVAFAQGFVQFVLKRIT